MKFIEPFLKVCRLVAGRLLYNPYKHFGVSRLRIKYLKLLQASSERTLKTKAGTIYYHSPLELAHGFEEIFANRIYEQVFPPGAYIIDCGANIGLSVLYFKLMAPDSVIEAFEPDLKNFSLLEKNVKSFNLNSVNLHKAAVWTEKTTLSFSSEGSMSSRINDCSKAEKNEGIFVDAIRLKGLINRRIDFLKIDIEGAEYRVLEDIKDNLHFVAAMFIDYHGSFSQNDELIRMLDIIKASKFVFYIKEATNLLAHPFSKEINALNMWNVQLNIFCIRL